MVAAAMIGSAVIGGVASSQTSKSAANKAANAQTASAAIAEEGINERFAQVQALLKPYSDAGQNSLFAQQTLLGMNGNDAQQQAINQLQQSPAFTSLLQRGENSLLQNASATGGLRGGNTQAALAQFSPQLLAQMIDAQYAKLGGITSLGQNAAAGTGNAGMQAGNAVANLLQQSGAAQAGAALAGGRAQAGLYSSLGGAAGLYGGMGGFRGAAGGTPSAGYQGIAQSGADGFIDPINYGSNYG